MHRLYRKCSCLVVIVFMLVQSCATKDKPDLNSSVLAEGANAKIAFKRGEYRSAVGLYKDLLVKYPANQEFLLYYAESLRISGEPESAILLYNQLAAKNNLSAIEGRGLAYLQQGEVAKAIVDFNIIIEKNSPNWRIFNAMGVAHSMEGKEAEATKYYNNALETDPGNPSIINNIAISAAFSGDATKGISLLQEALLKPDITADKKRLFENNLALLYGISGKMDEAEKLLRKSLPEPAVYNNLGFYAKIASDKKLAWGYLSKAVGTSPVYYEKAKNNLEGLAEESTVSKGMKDSADINAGNTKEPSTETQTPVKAWRGTHKLPLPTLRPE